MIAVPQIIHRECNAKWPYKPGLLSIWEQKDDSWKTKSNKAQTKAEFAAWGLRIPGEQFTVICIHQKHACHGEWHPIWGFYQAVRRSQGHTIHTKSVRSRITAESRHLQGTIWGINPWSVEQHCMLDIQKYVFFLWFFLWKVIFIELHWIWWFSTEFWTRGHACFHVKNQHHSTMWQQSPW